MIYQGVHAGFAYFQREAGYAHTGSHGKRVDGRETGKWHEADLVVAHWLQHTSRDGDMQLHVHSQIAHTARTITDGKWRAPARPGDPRLRLPSALPRRCDGRATEVFHPRPETNRAGTAAPRGALVRLPQLVSFGEPLRHMTAHRSRSVSNCRVLPSRTPTTIACS
jgi:hypothetical protein